MTKEGYKQWGVNLKAGEWEIMEKTLSILGYGHDGGRVAFVRVCMHLCRSKAFEELLRNYHRACE